jgi:hypothetical protein
MAVSPLRTALDGQQILVYKPNARAVMYIDAILITSKSWCNAENGPIDPQPCELIC